MTQRHELRWGGFAGLGFIVLAVLAALLPGVPPRVTATQDSIASYVADGRSQMLLAALLYATAAGLLIWFGAAFAEAIREREERSDVHMALLAGVVLIGAALFMYGAALGVLAYGADLREVATTVGLFQGLMVLNALLGFAAALPLTAAGIYAPGGSLMPFVSLTAGGIFVAVASGYMVREHLPEAAPMTLPQT